MEAECGRLALSEPVKRSGQGLREEMAQILEAGEEKNLGRRRGPSPTGAHWPGPLTDAE